MKGLMVGLAVMLAGAAWAAAAGAGYVTVVAVGMMIVLVDLARAGRTLAETDHDNATGLRDFARVTAHWAEVLGRRVGQIDAKAWVCRACLQTNAAWDDECGRCGADKVTGRVEEGMGTEARWTP